MDTISRRAFAVSLLIVVLLPAAGCAQQRETRSGILGTSWKLARIDLHDRSVDVEDMAAPTATFDVDTDGNARVTGTGGVNRYFAGYRTEGESISIDELGSTRMGGPPDRLRTEALFFRQLQNATAWRIEDNTLILLTPDGQVAFEKLE